MLQRQQIIEASHTHINGAGCLLRRHSIFNYRTKNVTKFYRISFLVLWSVVLTHYITTYILFIKFYILNKDDKNLLLELCYQK